MLVAVGIDCGVIKLITLECVTPHYQAYDTSVVKYAQELHIEISVLVIRSVKRIEKYVISNLVLILF